MRHTEIDPKYFDDWRTYRADWVAFFGDLHPDWERKEFYKPTQGRATIIEMSSNKLKPRPWIMEFVGTYPTNTRILDNASGYGRDSFGLAEMGYSQVTLLEKNPDILRAVEQRIRETKLKIGTKHGFSQNLPFGDGEFGVVIYNRVLSLQLSLEEMRKALEENHRVLRRGGFLLGTTESSRTMENEGNMEHWIQQYRRNGMAPVVLTKEQLEELFAEAGFDHRNVYLSDEKSNSHDPTTYGIDFKARK